MKIHPEIHSTGQPKEEVKHISIPIEELREPVVESDKKYDICDMIEIIIKFIVLFV